MPRCYTFVCKKHKKTARAIGGHPLCPICRKEMKCMGDRHRIGAHGKFAKIERKTRKFAGQEPLNSARMRLALSRRRSEALRLKAIKDFLADNS